MSDTKLRFPFQRSGGSQSGIRLQIMSPNWLETTGVNFIKLQQKVKFDKKVSHLQGLGLLAQDQGQESRVSLRAFQGIFHTVTFSCLSSRCRWTTHVLVTIDCNIETPKIINQCCPKNGTVWFYCAVMHPTDADGMANSADPNKTASIEAVLCGSTLLV